jgi:hypothetical protein
MKKTILALIMAGSSCAVFAQDDSTMSSVSTYNAYGTYAPTYVQSYIVRDYPMANNVMWRQNGDWWQAYYMENDQPRYTYYNAAGQTFIVSLPVHQTMVPDEVVSKVNSMYGPGVYDITALKGSNSQQVYQVRILENGTLRSEWINEDGTKSIDIYRVETTDMNNVNSGINNNMDASATTTEATDMNTNTKVKTKITHSDGTQTKIKTKNGKTTVKE